MLTFLNALMTTTSFNLPARLRVVAGLVPWGSSVADIGSDHALLPLYLVASGRSPRVIVVEVAPGPYRRALAAVTGAGLTERVEVRRGDGLEPLRPGEVDTVTMAGLGALTQQEILAARPEVRRRLRRLVLQPQGQAGPLRRYLAACGWRLLDEDLVYETGHYYFIMAAVPGVSPEYSDLEWELGPLLLQKRHPLLAGYIADKMEKLTAAVRELGRSQRAAARERREELQRLLLQLGEVSTWLQSAARS
ncbi:tRNA (adenine(22)-N(1))-methyltransferase [Moorella thermoacetica]|uniref:tRNA (Adenine(22)-N(1))-methyltransferase n=1 Tax=Neomoorella thermoacetica TaxID=1525 RepID=A0A1J5JN91_NEOTH|nr:class I SAM-dependent methyltransferase [Moorella thermoacetica]OIQ08187.1 tRNA (adenine(22)-N(1))-methyltransferase [Moorella thermoacetica]